MLADLQVFVIDRIELAHQLERGFVLEVVPLALHLLMRFGEQLHRLTCRRLLPFLRRDTLRCAVFRRRSARR